MTTFAPLEALQTWQEKNHKWLELTDVHRETTNDIRITVMPFYMGTKVGGNQHQTSNLFLHKNCGCSLLQGKIHLDTKNLIGYVVGGEGGGTL